MPGENVVCRLDDASVLSAARARPESRRWLWTRDFGLIWSSQILSQIADGVSKLALLWFVYSVTGSALKTTIIGLLQTLPAIILGPLIGVTVDRLPKKAVLIGSDLARALLIGLIPCVLSVDRFTPGMLYLLTLGYGIASAMFVPALSASVPSLVDRSQFTAANALLQSTTSIGIIAGPALSGPRTPGAASLVLLENDGRHNFTPRMLADAPINLATVGAGDLNGDGLPDIVAGSLFLSQPTGGAGRLGRVTAWLSRKEGRR